jgi:hypothetical protein
LCGPGGELCRAGTCLCPQITQMTPMATFWSEPGEAGVSIKPRSGIPGNVNINVQAREAGDSPISWRLSPAPRARLSLVVLVPGACTPGSMLTRAPRADSRVYADASDGLCVM